MHLLWRGSSPTPASALYHPVTGQTPSGVPAMTLDHQGGWTVRSHIKEGNEVLLVRAWKPLPSRHVLRTLRESPKEKNPKRTISAS